MVQSTAGSTLVRWVILSLQHRYGAQSTAGSTLVRWVILSLQNRYGAQSTAGSTLVRWVILSLQHRYGAQSSAGSTLVRWVIFSFLHYCSPGESKVELFDRLRDYFITCSVYFFPYSRFNPGFFCPSHLFVLCIAGDWFEDPTVPNYLEDWQLSTCETSSFSWVERALVRWVI